MKVHVVLCPHPVLAVTAVVGPQQTGADFKLDGNVFATYPTMTTPMPTSHLSTVRINDIDRIFKADERLSRWNYGPIREIVVDNVSG